MKTTTLRILATFLALLFVLLSFSACGKKVSKNPDEAILEAINTTQKLSAKSEMAMTMERYADFNSIEYNINLSDLIGSVFSAAMGGMEVSLNSKLDLNMKMLTKDNTSFASLALLLNDTDFVRLDAHENAEKIALACEALLGDTAYGASLENLVNWIEKQYDVSLEESGISFDALMTQTLEMNTKTDELVKAFDKYKKVLIEALFENAETVRTEETVTVNGESAEAVVFTATLDEEAALKTLEKVYETYKNDAETRATVEDLVKLYGATEEDIADAYSEIEAFFEQTPESDEDETLDIRFVINEKKGNLVSITATFDEETLSITGSLDPENPNHFAIEFTDEFAQIYRVTENTEAKFAAEISIEAEGNKFVVPVSLDKTTDQYTLSITMEGDTIEMVGTWKTEKDLFSASLDEVRASIEGTEINIKTGHTITAKKSNEALPAMPEYTDFTKLDEKDLAELGFELENNLYTLLSLLPMELQYLFAGLMDGM